jgi:hypothetical protein
MKLVVDNNRLTQLARMQLSKLSKRQKEMVSVKLAPLYFAAFSFTPWVIIGFGLQSTVQKPLLSRKNIAINRPAVGIKEASVLPMSSIPIDTTILEWISSASPVPSLIRCFLLAASLQAFLKPSHAKQIMIGALLLIYLPAQQREYLKAKRATFPRWNEIDTATTLNVVASKTLLEKIRDEAQTYPIDYIILGSGLGGLTAASCLSKAGYKVLVLEQHHTAGGSTHTFQEQGNTFSFGKGMI